MFQHSDFYCHGRNGFLWFELDGSMRHVAIPQAKVWEHGRRFGSEHLCHVDAVNAQSFNGLL